MSDIDKWAAALGRERPANPANVRAYRLLAEAQIVLARELATHGLDDDAITEAFDRCANDVVDGDDVPAMCAEILSRCVAEFGGRLELRAVFPDADVTLLSDGDLTSPHEAG